MTTPLLCRPNQPLPGETSHNQPLKPPARHCKPHPSAPGRKNGSDGVSPGPRSRGRRRRSRQNRHRHPVLRGSFPAAEPSEPDTCTCRLPAWSDPDLPRRRSSMFSRAGRNALWAPASRRQGAKTAATSPAPPRTCHGDTRAGAGAGRGDSRRRRPATLSRGSRTHGSLLTGSPGKCLRVRVRTRCLRDRVSRSEPGEPRAQAEPPAEPRAPAAGRRRGSLPRGAALPRPAERRVLRPGSGAARPAPAALPPQARQSALEAHGQRARLPRSEGDSRRRESRPRLLHQPPRSADRADSRATPVHGGGSAPSPRPLQTVTSVGSSEKLLLKTGSD